MKIFGKSYYSLNKLKFNIFCQSALFLFCRQKNQENILTFYSITTTHTIKEIFPAQSFLVVTEDLCGQQLNTVIESPHLSKLPSPSTVAVAYKTIDVPNSFPIDSQTKLDEMEMTLRNEENMNYLLK